MALYAAVLRRDMRPLIEVRGPRPPRTQARALDATLGRAMEHLAPRQRRALIYHEALTGAAHLVPLTRVDQPILARALGEMKRELGSPWAEKTAAAWWRCGCS
jgi:hypothetical protein